MAEDSLRMIGSISKTMVSGTDPNTSAFIGTNMDGLGGDLAGPPVAAWPAAENRPTSQHHLTCNM